MAKRAGGADDARESKRLRSLTKRKSASVGSESEPQRRSGRQLALKTVADQGVATEPESTSEESNVVYLG